MKKFLLIALFLLSQAVLANSAVTQRIPQINNDNVEVWQTIIYPTSPQQLKPHRHDRNRVVVALTNGILKVTNDKGRVHYLRLTKGQSYYLTKDIPGELHTDENMTHHVIKVIVVELKG